jgi:hypothetical protein
MHAVPRKVLKDRFEEQPEEDELAVAATGDSMDENEDLDSYDTDEFFRESAAFSPSPNVDGNPHDKNMTKDLTHRTTTKTPPYAKSKGGGTGNSELVACMYVMCFTLCTLALQGLWSQQTNKQQNYHQLRLYTDKISGGQG